MGDKDGVVDQAQFHFTRSLTKKYGSFEEAAGKVQAKNGKKTIVANPYLRNNVRLSNGGALGALVFYSIVNGKRAHRLRCTSDCLGGRVCECTTPLAKALR